MTGRYSEPLIMYDIPKDMDRVIIDPKRDNATFTYMDVEYSFGEITDNTRGELILAPKGGLASKGGKAANAQFRIFEIDEDNK